MPHNARDVRYVLVARDAATNRVAVMSTPRSLVNLAPIHRSLFALYSSAVSIDVLLPWPPGAKLDDQEVLISAERSNTFERAINWPKERDLKAIEADITKRLEESTHQ